jgi:hypothetical protein
LFEPSNSSSADAAQNLGRMVYRQLILFFTPQATQAPSFVS